MAWYSSTKDFSKAVSGHSAEDRLKGAVTGAVAGAQAGGPVGAIGGAVGGAAVGQENIQKEIGRATNKITGGPVDLSTPQIADTATTGAFAPSLGGALTNRTEAVTTPGVSSLASSLAEERSKLGNRTPELAPVERVDRAQISNVTIDPITGATIDTTQQAQFRGAQTSLVDALSQQAAGTGGPTAAQLQLQQATDRGLAQQLALQAGLSGAEAAAARRAGAVNVGAMTQEAGREAAILRAQEQQAAQGLLADVAGQARDADIVLATSQAKLDQQTQVKNMEAKLQADLANQGVDLDVLKTNAAAGNQGALAQLEAALTTMGFDDAQIRAYLAIETDLIQLDQQAALQAQEMDVQLEQLYYKGQLTREELAQKKAIAQAEIEAGVRTAKGDSKSKMMSGLLGAGATLGAAYVASSDVNSKTNIKKNDKRIADFLSSLDNYDYDYKNPKHGIGKHTSVMAQDLEKSEIGRKAVIETPEGKMVNYGKINPEMLSALVMHNKKIDKLEATLKDALLSKKVKKGKK